MAKRYEPRSPFSVYINGIPRTFKPNRIDPVTKLQGYSAAELKGLTKDQRASFKEIGAEFEESEAPVIEQATAAPGEKRTAKRTSAAAARSTASTKK